MIRTPATTKMQADRSLPRAVAIAVALSSWGCGDAAPSSPRDAAVGLDAAASDAALGEEPDAEPRDAEPPDASELDANEPDERAPDAFVPPQVVPPEEGDDTPFYLSETGLYQDIAAHELAPDLIAFEPQHALWSDGADKRRWLRLPPGTKIDTSNPDHWIFPIGTMLFKEFALEGKRIETRLIMRLAPERHDYFMGAFVWNDDESDALFVREGEQNARGTDHDVPRVKNCFTCHDGEAGRVLGFSAVQQPNAAAALLTDPPARPFEVPGNAIEQRALGYLHANCGHCHNLNGTSWPDTDLDLRLTASDTMVEDTAAYRSAVGVELTSFQDAEITLRIAAGDPERSGLYHRMSLRGPMKQMPPLATELVDDTGLSQVRAWIESPH
jgi:hypothetical protein